MANTITPIDVTTPLGNNELASFMKIMRGNDGNEIANVLLEALEKNMALENKRNDAICKRFDAQTEAINVLNSTLTKVLKAISSNTDVMRTVIDKQPTIVVNPPENKTDVKSAVNPLFYSSIPVKDCKLWAEKVRGEIAKICMEEKVEKALIYKQIYASMERSGYDISKLLTEYKELNPNGNKITMVACSDALRESFSKYVNSYAHKQIVNKLKEQMVSKNHLSAEAMFCPENVKQIVRRFAGTDNPSGSDFSRAYKLLDLNKDEYLAEAKKRIGYKNVSIGYAIGTNPAMVTRLDNAVTAYLKKEGK